MQHHSLWAKCASNTLRKLRKHRKRFFLLWSLIRRPKKTLLQARKPLKIDFFLPTSISDNHGQRSWDWAFSSSHRSNFSPHTTNNVGRVYPEFFPRFNLYRVGGRDNCKKISKRMHCFMKEHRMTEKYEYCITVPRSFVHDCSVSRRRVIFLVLSF